MSYLLLGAGVVLVILALVWRRASGGVRADRRGIVIQGNNPGVANTGTIKGDVLQGAQGERPPAPKPNPWIRALELTGAVCGIIGLLLTLWNPFQS